MDVRKVIELTERLGAAITNLDAMHLEVSREVGPKSDAARHLSAGITELRKTRAAVTKLVR